MNRPACLAAMALLGLGILIAQSTQNTKPSSDASNSSSSASQSTAGSTSGSVDQSQGATPGKRRHAGDQRKGVPDTTVRDRQSSTTSRTGAAGQDNTQAPAPNMGTSGSTPGTPDQGSSPQNNAPTDQQPNSTTSPSTSPRAQIAETPAARAVATHTPDPGTCMNPAALQAGVDGQAARRPGCE